ncbi:4a-hydroxytetrahydrobiopterin dehydratase [Synoicihabitans lomoniglobus]|uniref:Putative pterin-4-alpha-carbinolamine dehydratase n=1 Tax=Synoicihabitans lomoniglobus TaxID=2909285 RepID=A0AAE9ZW15_9BACT|nr:4a-hydroxytetrahydrobiopterin dehydratase [Opitutaceae bacterium LMO-M01]WED63533.1 4a-hydroxytetrahydrobiopterin dehydratase [Opitutaceae bacterium LMO-M01]
MSADPPLEPAAIQSALAALPGWSVDGDSLTKEYTFADFRAALVFMMQVGFEADAMDHHPEWTNVYDTVTVRLRTHHAGNKITAKDITLATAMEKIVTA